MSTSDFIMAFSKDAHWHEVRIRQFEDADLI